MRTNFQTYIVFRQLATYLLISSGFEVTAVPAPQDASTSATPTPVTEVTTVSGSTITEIFTPTSFSISGLIPPIVNATTVTQVVTSSGTAETVAIAIEAGAGIVAAGALAAWLFKPVPGAPPAPTKPPSYSTSSQTTTTTSTTSSSTSSSTTSEEACPFTQVNPSKDFQTYTLDPTWTGAVPTLTTSSIAPSCTPQGSNGQLYRGTDPGYINALAAVFCKNDLSKDQAIDLGEKDLPDGNTYKTSAFDGINIKFNFKFAAKNDGCAQNCVDAYSRMITTCQYNSHSLYGGDSLVQGCGTYSFMIDAEPNTKLVCNDPDKSGPYINYDYLDSAQQRITDFCNSVDGKVIKQNDKSTWIEPTDPKTDFFSIEYASNCQGSGSYTITKDNCNNYLGQTLNGCDTNTIIYKHGGTLTDTDNCGQFKFTPRNYDDPACYPTNKNNGYITDGTHVQIKQSVAMDAISQFCGRSGGGQQYTLDPNNIPSSGNFVQDTCTTAGYAACAYYYNKDGSRVTKAGDTGDMVIRMQASYWEPNGFACQAKQKYDIHGQRCIDELTKVVTEWCNTNTADAKDLGSFLESGDYGCVRWDMWTVATH